MIAFDDVTVRASQSVLLKDITFSLDAGEKAVVTGPSGSGKSTILLTLMGAHAPSRGRVRFDGTEVTAQTVASVRNAVAFIGQEPVLGNRSVRDGLLLPFTFRANRDARPGEERISEILHGLKLPSDILDRSTAVISGGEKQRIAVARALLTGKNTFVVDEITSALDETSNQIVLDLFLRPGITVLAVSHQGQWLKRFDKQIRIVDGTVAGVRHNRGGDT
jgi:putative ABC transport system ATP-binding protein